MSAAGMQGGPPAPAVTTANSGNSTPLAPGQVQALDTGQAVTPVQYVNAFTPGQDNSLTTDPGVTRIIDPMGNQVQVPVVAQTIAVEKTSSGVMLALGAIVLYLFFKRG